MIDPFAKFGVSSGLLVPLTDQYFSWSDYDPYKLIEADKKISHQNFSRISSGGHILYSTGCAQIMFGFLISRWKSSMALDFLDALWASVLSDSYFPPLEIDFGDFKGSIKGMTALALTNALNSWCGSDEGNSALDAAFAYDTLQHLFGNQEIYFNWTSKVIERLEEFAPYQGETSVIDRLPLEILCPNLALDKRNFPDLMDKSIDLLELDKNLYARKSTT